jgi:predicted ATPase
MFSQVRFQNLRALAKLTLDLEPFTVLVGPNGCGKSTVLAEINRMCAMTHPRTQPGGQPVNLLSGPGALLQEEKGPPPHTTGLAGPMVWSATTPTSSFHFQLGDPTRQAWWEQAELRLTTSEKTLALGPDRQTPDPGNGKVSEVDQLLHQSFRWRAQHLAPQRTFLLLPSPFDAPLDALDPTGYGLATLLLHMAANASDRYAAIIDDLRRVVPHFDRLHIYTRQSDNTNKGPEGGYYLDFVFKGAGRIPADRASEGSLFALTLLTALHAPDMPTVILIDDIDHGLHLSAQYQLIRAIREGMARRPEIQVICTTHSPFLFEGIDGKEVRVMALDAEYHCRAKPLTDHPEYHRWQRVMTTGEVWANLGEDWVARD